MKKHGAHFLVRKGGILHWSTLCLLASGGLSLNACKSDTTYTATPEDIKMAELQKQLDEVENRRSQLMNGLLENNFELAGLGFYHAEAQEFFPHRFGHEQDGKWFANGAWVAQKPADPSPFATKPSAETLAKIEQQLQREQELAQQSPSSGQTSTVHHHHGSGVGSMLMMYWLLSANRGSYSPGAGFHNASNQQGNWQQTVNNQRNAVRAHASANPGYSRLVEQSQRSGRPVTQGSSVRGGFGTSSRSSRLSSGG